MLYRDYLLSCDLGIEAYVGELCGRFRGTFDSHILKMYELIREYGVEELGCACALASEHGAYGSDYLAALLKRPRNIPALSVIEVQGVPHQNEVDRTLESYEAFVMGGERS